MKKTYKIKENDKEASDGLYIPFSLESIKETFPELRNFDGRFFRLFLKELYDNSIKFLEDFSEEIDKWVKFAKEELDDKLCYDEYVDDPLCNHCTNIVDKGGRIYCGKYPQMGEKWQGEKKDTPCCLVHPVSFCSWYWCIKVCPEFKHKDGKKKKNRRENNPFLNSLFILPQKSIGLVF